MVRKVRKRRQKLPDWLEVFSRPKLQVLLQSERPPLGEDHVRACVCVWGGCLSTSASVSGEEMATKARNVGILRPSCFLPPTACLFTCHLARLQMAPHSTQGNVGTSHITPLARFFRSPYSGGSADECPAPQPTSIPPPPSAKSAVVFFSPCTVYALRGC